MWSTVATAEIVVAGARIYEVALPLRSPFRISGGRMTVRRSVIIELEAEDGTRGFGEAAPFELPFYSGETIDSVTSCLKLVLLPRVIGLALAGPAALWEILTDGVRGNHMARAGVDSAYWDLWARRRGASLCDLVTERLAQLGAPDWSRERLDRIECGVALGIPDSERPADLVGEALDAVRRGYRRVKLKIRPGWDVEPVRAVLVGLAAAGRSVPVSVDANGAYDAARDRETIRELDQLGLLFLEQPFAPEAVWDAAKLNIEARTPVCVDETLVSDTMARQLVDMGGPMIWNLKVQRLGGIEETCRVFARGAAHGAELWVGTMPETGLGAQSALAVAAHAGCVFPTDVEPSTRWYASGVDLVELTMDEQGTMAVPGGPAGCAPSDQWKLLAEIRGK